MSTTLFLSGVAASFGAHPLFSGLDATVAPGDVTALVGPNGSGKTTLLRIVAGEQVPDAGSVRFAPPDAAVGYLPQSPPAPEESILGYARRRTGVGPAQAAFESAAAALASVEPGSDERYARALDRWLTLGGADLEARLAEVLARLDLVIDADRPLGTLSGGQAARAGLASILVSRYDVLLLDEPTNNLDADGREALAAFVAGQSAPVLVASHDRAFLDAVATSVLELDYHQQAVHAYTGGWSDYRAAKSLARSQAEQAYATYAARRADLVERARRQNEWARQGRSKAGRLGPHQQLAKKYAEDSARKLDQRAARVRDAVGRLPEVEQPRKEWDLRFTIAAAAESAEVVLALDGVVFGVGDFRVGPISAQVVRGDRVALTGPNGVGKSTVLDTLLGVRPPVSGRISWGTRVALGTLDQGRTAISGPDSLLAVVAGLLGEDDPAAVRTLLAKFGLGAEHIVRACDTLSLGERTRAALAVLQGRAVNVVVLDEPTNHLDVAAIEQLEDALVAFAGTVLIVTHDQALREALAPSLTWEFRRHADSATVDVRPEGPARNAAARFPG